MGRFRFGKPVDGKPEAKMRTTSPKFYDFELAAVDAAAKKEGISRSAFIRRACGNELVARMICHLSEVYATAVIKALLRIVATADTEEATSSNSVTFTINSEARS